MYKLIRRDYTEREIWRYLSSSVTARVAATCLDLSCYTCSSCSKSCGIAHLDNVYRVSLFILGNLYCTRPMLFSPGTSYDKKTTCQRAHLMLPTRNRLTTTTNWEFSGYGSWKLSEVEEPVKFWSKIFRTSMLFCRGLGPNGTMTAL